MDIPNWQGRYSDADRRIGRRAFVVTAVVVVLISTGLALEAPQRAPSPRRPRAHPVQRSGHRADAGRSAAFIAALRFANSYLAFLYGGSPAGAVSPASSGLRGQLVRGRALVTPAELHRQ